MMKTRKELHARYRQKIKSMPDLSTQTEEDVPSFSPLPELEEEDPFAQYRKRKWIAFAIKVGALVLVIVAFIIWYNLGIKGAR